MTPLARRLSIALVVSVALNLLLIGVFVGRALTRGDGHRRHAELAGRRGPHPGMQRLLAERRPELERHREAVRGARRGAIAALAEEPFDRAKLERELARLREETLESQAVLHRAVAESAASASPEARRQLADAFKKGPGRKGGHARDRDRSD